MLKNRIREFILELLERNNDHGECADDSQLITSNRLDSLNLAELIVYIEDEYNVYMSTSDPDFTKKLDSINEIVDFISSSEKV